MLDLRRGCVESPVEPLSSQVELGSLGGRCSHSLGSGEVFIRVGLRSVLLRWSLSPRGVSLIRSLFEGGSLRQLALPWPQRVGSRNCPLSASAG